MVRAEPTPPERIRHHSPSISSQFNVHAEQQQQQQHRLVNLVSFNSSSFLLFFSSSFSSNEELYVASRPLIWARNNAFLF